MVEKLKIKAIYDDFIKSVYLTEEHPYGKYAVTMNGHITAIINGTIIDTFYPNKIMRCAWRID